MKGILVVEEIEKHIQELRDKANRLEEGLKQIIDQVGVRDKYPFEIKPFAIKVDSTIDDKWKRENQSRGSILNIKQDKQGNYYSTKSSETTDKTLHEILDLKPKSTLKKKKRYKTVLQKTREQEVLVALRNLHTINRHFKKILREIYGPFTGMSEVKKLTKTLLDMVEEGTLTKDTSGKAHIYSIVK